MSYGGPKLFQNYNTVLSEESFDIIYYEKTNWVGINNRSHPYINIEFIDLDMNFSLFGSLRLKNLNFKSNKIESGKKYIIIVSLEGLDEIFIYNVELNDGKLYIHKISNLTENNDKLNFVIFTGHMGGGTSVVVKMLRYLGLYFGDDCGNIENRKTHESVSIRHCINHMLNENGLSYPINSFKKVMSVYKYEENEINCFKNIFISQKINEFSEMINDFKVVSIIKNPNSFHNSGEGQRFSETTESERMKFQRPLVEGVPMFHLDFYKFFTDYNYVNKVLKFVGSDKRINDFMEFKLLKNKIGFDERALK